jgi:hypothetical protein
MQAMVVPHNINEKILDHVGLSVGEYKPLAPVSISA